MSSLKLLSSLVDLFEMLHARDFTCAVTVIVSAELGAPGTQCVTVNWKLHFCE